MLEKYGVDTELMRKLIAAGLVKDEDEAREKVASGMAKDLLDEFLQKEAARKRVIDGQ